MAHCVVLEIGGGIVMKEKTRRGLENVVAGIFIGAPMLDIFTGFYFSRTLRPECIGTEVFMGMLAATYLLTRRRQLDTK